MNEFNIAMLGEKEMGHVGNLFGRTAANYFDPIKRSTNGFTVGQLYPQANPDDILPGASFGFIPNAAYLGADIPAFRTTKAIRGSALQTTSAGQRGLTPSSSVCTSNVVGLPMVLVRTASMGASISRTTLTIRSIQVGTFPTRCWEISGNIENRTAASST